MRAVIVYESMFGNTKEIALAIAKGLATGLEADVLEVGEATGQPGDDVGLLVVGGPTHAFGLSRASTRRSAADQATAPVVSARGGIREWLDDVPRARDVLTAAATFDTHIDKPRWLPGSAARSAAKRLRGLGYRLAVPPESFFVTGTPGRLLDGELDRARDWGEQLAALCCQPRRL
jgi:hypothetical protein